MNKKKLFVSNLCWKKENLKFIVKTIKNERISGIDFAPLNYFKSWKNVLHNCKILNKFLIKENIKVNAIQGIFYKKNLNIFKNKDEKKITKHFVEIIKICRIFRAKKIILGSSNFRDPGQISSSDADEIFVKYFKNLNKLLKKNKIHLCLETIPKKYNENYISKFSHIVRLVKKINSSNIKINFDTSIFHFEPYNFNFFSKNIRYIKNIQVSQPGFKYFEHPTFKNRSFLKSIKKSSTKSISLEIISRKIDKNKFLMSLKNLKKHVT